MLSRHFFRPRGWALLVVALASLGLASMLGRRDLLMLAVFCFALPAVAYASLHLIKHGFSVRRLLAPQLGRVGAPVEVTLEVHGRAPGGARTKLDEELPFSFRDAPTFSHPQAVVPRGLLSRYHYTLHPSHRGVFTIGPLRGEFADPFDVAFVPRVLDAGTRLTIAPAAVELPAISLTDGRGQDGSQFTRELAHASADDAMTREYRHGDPLRRVHWPVTARAGKLMVRAEESVTTPEAALILDRRSTAFGEVSRTRELFQIAGRTTVGLPDLHTTVIFETAVVAALSIASHLMEHGYTLRILDHLGQPGFASSGSATDPEREEFAGSQGLVDVAAALAAQELAEAAGPNTSAGPAHTSVSSPFSDSLAHKLHDGRRRGPLVAVTGLLNESQALALAGLNESTQSAYALVLCQDPAKASPAVAVLRRAGWRVAAMTPNDSLADVWLNLDGSTGMTVRQP